MKKILIIVILVFLIYSSGFSSTNDSDQILNSKIINEIEESFKSGPEIQALQNALRNNQFKQLFYNRDILLNHNINYTYEIKSGKITDQKGTGRCWLYAALNTIRPSIVKKLNMDNFEFSTNYYYFWDKLEKANHFLERAINKAALPIRSLEFQSFLGSPIDDGGYWQNAVDLVEKYGLVPLSAMPEVNSNESSRSMNSTLTFLLRNMAYQIKTQVKLKKSIKEIRLQKVRFLKDIYRILVLNLGKPVKSFPFRYYNKDKDGEKTLTPYKTYTPQSFAKEFADIDLNRFVMFANWPGRPYYKLYEWDASNNILGGTRLTFINLPMDEIKKMAVESLKNNIPVNFSADVGKQLDSKRGIMHSALYDYHQVYQIPFNKDKKINTLLRNINSTHAMVFLGVDIKDNLPLKWKVENSWGTDRGYKGFYAMYDNWVDLYVVRVVVDKQFIPQNILQILKTSPLVIPDTEPEK